VTVELLADENFNRWIVAGVRRRGPSIDLITVQEAGLRGMSDPDLLEWAAARARIVLTHDVRTLTRDALDRVRLGLPMPGVIELREDAPIGRVIEDIVLLALGSSPGEWEGQVVYLPLR
jgi:hypothetical protein